MSDTHPLQSLKCSESADNPLNQSPIVFVHDMHSSQNTDGIHFCSFKKVNGTKDH